MVPNHVADILDIANPCVKLVADAILNPRHIDAEALVKIKNILEGVNSISTLPTTLATILAIKHAKLPRVQREVHIMCHFAVAFQCNNRICKRVV